MHHSCTGFKSHYPKTSHIRGLRHVLTRQLCGVLFDIKLVVLMLWWLWVVFPFRPVESEMAWMMQSCVSQDKWKCSALLWVQHTTLFMCAVVFCIGLLKWWHQARVQCGHRQRHRHGRLSLQAGQQRLQDLEQVHLNLYDLLQSVLRTVLRTLWLCCSINRMLFLGIFMALIHTK